MMEFRSTIRKREKILSKITTIGLDLAKNVFHVVCCDARGKVVRNRKLKRSQVLPFFGNLEGCLVGMEACAGSHHWSQELEALRFEVKRMAARYVKPYVRGNKNDYNDALAIAEAVVRPEMRFVRSKSPEQQDIQALHRMRKGCIGARTALCNRMRGLAGEYGLVAAKGIATLRRRIPEWLEDGNNGLNALFRRLLCEGIEQLRELDGQLAFTTRGVERLSEHDAACQRLQTIPGFGPIVASAFHGQISHGEAFRLTGPGAAPAPQWRQRHAARHQQAR